MVAVAQASPAQLRPLVVVRTTPVVRPQQVRATTAATYRRRRLMAATVATAMVVVLFLALSALASPVRAPAAAPGAGSGASLAGEGVHVVQPGDTFWGIARSLRPNEDPRPLVDRMVAAHGSPSLMVGERITLPAGS